MNVKTEIAPFLSYLLTRYFCFIIGLLEKKKKEVFFYTGLNIFIIKKQSFLYWIKMYLF